MKLTLLALAPLALAMPAIDQAVYKRQANVCAGITGTAQCCATDVLGVADLNCASPPSVPTDVQNFIDICAAIGQQAECCFLPLLGQALVCNDPI